MKGSPPEITITQVGYEFVLMANSHGRSAIVGPRILRGNGVLDIDIRHPTRELAEAAAEKLRTYLAGQGKPGKHRGEVQPEQRRKGFWED